MRHGWREPSAMDAAPSTAGQKAVRRYCTVEVNDHEPLDSVIILRVLGSAI